MYDHIKLNVYQTPGGDWCIGKTVSVGRHEQWEPLARFAFGPYARVFANQTARLMGDFFATDDIETADEPVAEVTA